MAAIRQQPNGRWQAIVRRQGVVKSATFGQKADADAWARKIESEIERGVWKDTTEAERTTLRDLIDIYREKILPGLRGNGYVTALSHLEQQLGDKTLARLSSADVARYRDKRLAAVSGDTVRKELGVLSRIVDLAAMEWGFVIAANPCKLVKKPAPGKARDRRLADEEAVRMWASLAQSRNRYMLPLCRFAVETAMRRGEILKLDWRHVDLKGRTAHLPKTKTEPRTVPLSSAAVAILKELLPMGGDGKPIRRLAGQVFPVSESLVAQAWSHALARARRLYVRECEAAGEAPDDHFLVGLRLHDLRHEATSRLFERGTLGMMEVAAITGHKTLEMLKRYTHLRAEELARKLG